MAGRASLGSGPSLLAAPPRVRVPSTRGRRRKPRPLQAAHPVGVAASWPSAPQRCAPRLHENALHRQARPCIRHASVLLHREAHHRRRPILDQLARASSGARQAATAMRRPSPANKRARGRGEPAATAHRATHRLTHHPRLRPRAPWSAATTTGADHGKQNPPAPPRNPQDPRRSRPAGQPRRHHRGAVAVAWCAGACSYWPSRIGQPHLVSPRRPTEPQGSSPAHAPASRRNNSCPRPCTARRKRR